MVSSQVIMLSVRHGTPRSPESVGLASSPCCSLNTCCFWMGFLSAS